MFYPPSLPPRFHQKYFPPQTSPSLPPPLPPVCSEQLVSQVSDSFLLLCRTTSSVRAMRKSHKKKKTKKGSTAESRYMYRYTSNVASQQIKAYCYVAEGFFTLNIIQQVRKKIQTW